MAKKGGKLLGLLAIGAAAAGAYYYTQKKDKKVPENMDDEDLDNFDQDLDDGPTAKPSSGKRSYTNLNFSDIEGKVKDAAVKFADTADKCAASVSEKLQGAASKVEDFFDDRKPAEDIEVEADASEDAEDEEPETEETGE